VDEAYLRKAITQPNADVVKGFAPAMPPYQLKDVELEEMIGYFKAGVASGAAQSKIDGKKLAQEKGCLGCHSVDGVIGIGPSLKGLYGSKVKVVRNGKPETVTVDASFLKESIKEPGATIVEGFQPIMPPYPDFSDAEMDALLKWMEGLK
jgi:cytochrome c oxidase subunit 2